MRYLKNTVNGRFPFPWTKVLSLKSTMIECDFDGNPIVDKVSLEDGKVLQALEEKAAEANMLRKENAVQKQIIEKYEKIHGKLGEQLPEKTVEKVIEDAEKKSETPASKDYESKTNKVLTSEIKDRNLDMPEKINKDNLIAVLEAADKGE